MKEAERRIENQENGFSPFDLKSWVKGETDAPELWKKTSGKFVKYCTPGINPKLRQLVIEGGWLILYEKVSPIGAGRLSAEEIKALAIKELKDRVGRKS